MSVWEALPSPRCPLGPQSPLPAPCQDARPVRPERESDGFTWRREAGRLPVFSHGMLNLDPGKPEAPRETPGHGTEAPCVRAAPATPARTQTLAVCSRGKGKSLQSAPHPAAGRGGAGSAHTGGASPPQGGDRGSGHRAGPFAAVWELGLGEGGTVPGSPPGRLLTPETCVHPNPQHVSVLGNRALVKEAKEG